MSLSFPRPSTRRPPERLILRPGDFGGGFGGEAPMSGTANWSPVSGSGGGDCVPSAGSGLNALLESRFRTRLLDDSESDSAEEDEDVTLSTIFRKLALAEFFRVRAPSTSAGGGLSGGGEVGGGTAPYPADVGRDSEACEDGGRDGGWLGVVATVLNEPAGWCELTKNELPVYCGAPAVDTVSRLPRLTSALGRRKNADGGASTGNDAICGFGDGGIGGDAASESEGNVPCVGVRGGSAGTSDPDALSRGFRDLSRRLLLNQGFAPFSFSFSSFSLGCSAGGDSATALATSPFAVNGPGETNFPLVFRAVIVKNLGDLEIELVGSGVEVAEGGIGSGAEDGTGMSSLGFAGLSACSTGSVGETGGVESAGGSTLSLTSGLSLSVLGAVCPFTADKTGEGTGASLGGRPSRGRSRSTA